jgi:ribosomal protein S18 acetylase RimI-like enzyme
MCSDSLEIRSATHDEMPQTVSSIVAAFITDPMTRFVCPGPHEYLSAMPLFTREFARGSLEHGTAYVCTGYFGAAIWLPPGVRPDDEVLERLFHEHSRPERLADVLATFERLEEWHPEEPHWHLPLIGVEPNMQNRGLGSALMRHAVTRFDQEGTLAYLESSNPRNIPLYQRHGFEVMGEVQVGAAPTVTPMLRRPRRQAQV